MGYALEARVGADDADDRGGRCVTGCSLLIAVGELRLIHHIQAPCAHKLANVPALIWQRRNRSAKKMVLEEPS